MPAAVKTQSKTANVFLDAGRKMAEYAQQHRQILVAYSGGKDSLATADLCIKAFGVERVKFFNMYLIPGLECEEKQLQFARDRWGVEILSYPHWVLFRCLKDGVFCPSYYKRGEMPNFTVHDIEQLVKNETGIDLVAHGGKKADSVWRRRMLHNTRNRTDRCYPILDWNKWDVLAYLASNKIPVPSQDSDSNSGVDLSTPSLLWLYDNYPADFDKLERVFPYVRAVIYRRQYYGVE